MKKTLEESLDLRMRRASAIWPRGFEDFWKELSELGFEPEIQADTQAELLNLSVFDSLRYPASHLIAEPSADHFGYTTIPLNRMNQSDRWGLMFVSKNQEWVKGVRVIRVSHPEAAVDWMMRRLHLPEWAGESSSPPKGVVTESQVHIGPDCELGEGVILESGVRLGARVQIGAGTRVRAGAVLRDDTVVGSHCDIGSGAVLGGPGFGLIRYPKKARAEQRTHIGRVVLGSEIRLGSLVAIDRGVFDDTIIGSQSAIDNIVQIGHNCEIGAGAVICALCGLSGSTSLGDNVTLAGMVGTKGHLHIGEGATVGAQSGVTKDLAPGVVVKGYPPRPMAEALEIQALSTRLPELYRRLKDLESKLSK